MKPVLGNPTTCLQLKLTRLKLAFSEWNKALFGNIDTTVKLATEEVIRIQHLIDASGVNDELQQLDYIVHLILTQALLNQDQFWREKARVQQFLQGDSNTSYYHRVAKIKAVTKQIHLINSDQGGLLTNTSDIVQHIVHYFQQIFCRANNCLSTSIVNDNIPTSVTSEDNILLTAIPTPDLINTTVFFR
ncbi:unnamed protein product [Trifolium pratense]|uniref:Uncharacterized protein n=1 Tax=Trifolium pratense TaxID=57577 RepID=A0ACB0JJ14_TRIPR|nr:unnamed protein product [Trifolium pratense]